METVIKRVEINLESFLLFREYDHKNGCFYWGTIPYSEMECGKLVRRLNGIDMCISFTSAADALKNRYIETALGWLGAHEVVKELSECTDKKRRDELMAEWDRMYHEAYEAANKAY